MRHVLLNSAFLELLCSSNPTLRKVLIKKASQAQKRAMFEFLVNLVNGNVPLTPAQKKKLSKYKTGLRRVRNICYNPTKNKVINTNSRRAKTAVVQVGGIFPLILAPLLALAGKAALGGAISAGAGYATKKIIDAASK